MLDAKPFVVMGVLNVTPDSFYDGGRYAAADAAHAQALAMIAAGADIIDIGGESSRPGAAPVTAEVEMKRVLPVIERLRAESSVIISIDTTKSAVANAALKAGATWINDTSAGRFDAGMARLAAAVHCPVVLMHSRKTPADMQIAPMYADVVAEVRKEILGRIAAFTECGVSPRNIIIDPGIGFAKRLEDNLALIKGLHSLVSLGYPVLIGTSRKSFIGAITGRQPDMRLAGTLASVAAAYAKGAKIFRVHDVGETVDFLKVLTALAV